MRAAIYCRISTKDKGQTHSLQLEALTPFIASRGWELVEIYQDTISGSKESRPALNKLMSDARLRKFDCVAVYRFDRMARSLSHLVRTMDEFRELGISFVSYSENIDTSTSVGKVLFAVIAAFSQFERDIIRERVQTRVTQLISSGVKWGRPRKCFRHDEALAELNAGGSLRTVAAKHGISHATLARRAKQAVEIKSEIASS